MHVLGCLRDIVWVLVQWRKPYMPSTIKQVWEMTGDVKAERLDLGMQLCK